MEIYRGGGDRLADLGCGAGRTRMWGWQAPLVVLIPILFCCILKLNSHPFVHEFDMMQQEWWQGKEYEVNSMVDPMESMGPR
jgi:hypothetical protein